MRENNVDLSKPLTAGFVWLLAGFIAPSINVFFAILGANIIFLLCVCYEYLKYIAKLMNEKQKDLVE